MSQTRRDIFLSSPPKKCDCHFLSFFFLLKSPTGQRRNKKCDDLLEKRAMDDGMVGMGQVEKEGTVVVHSY